MDQRTKPNTSALDAAQRSHLERPFKCFECHHVFRRVEHRTRHARSHEIERQLKCSYCRKGFYRLDALKRHEKVHSEPKRSLLKEGARACLTCATSRRKCSGDTPCSACERRSLECEYPVAGKSRQRALGSNSSGAEHMIAITRESIMTTSNASQSPVAASQGPDMTYRPVASDEDNVVKHTPNHQYGLVPGNIHFFDERDLEEIETTSSISSDSEAFENTRLPVDDDARDITRSPSVSSHGEGFTRSLVNAPVAICPTTPPYLLEFSVPAFIEFSEKRNRRALVDHFCNVFSHLVVFGEDLENPFQQLILPLARNGSPVMNAIYALSSAHLENRGVHTEEKSLYFHNEATRGLARIINHIERSSEEDVLSTILLLVYYEALVQRDSSNMVISHLKGAIAVINSFSQSSSPTSMFLQRAFRYYDVITALSFSTSPISRTSTPLLPLNILGARCLSPLIDVDSLLGMSTNFWHIIHRLSLLYELKGEMQKSEACSDTIKVTVLRTELECTSQAIEHALTQWKPSIQWLYESSTINTFGYVPPTTASSSGTPHSPSLESAYLDYDISFCDTTNSLTGSDAHIFSIANNAEAYRQAALVFLYRNVHMLERSHPKVQTHVHFTLAACVRVVRCAGPIPALLWPLFIGSVDAVCDEDRGIATMAFSGAEKRQGFLNITRAWDIVQEVWRRGDEGEAVDWRSICKEMGVSLVFG